MLNKEELDVIMKRRDAANTIIYNYLDIVNSILLEIVTPDNLKECKAINSNILEATKRLIRITDDLERTLRENGQ